MSLSYNGEKVIPAPLVNVNKQYAKTPAGTTVGAKYNITLTGTLLPFRGSPSGTWTDLAPGTAFWILSGDPPDDTYVGGTENFSRILRKQEAMRWLFSEDGKSLEWQPSEGQPVMKCQARVLSIDFTPGTWADRCDYTITLEADRIFIPTLTVNDEDGFDPNLLQSASDDWIFGNVEGSSGNAYLITHTVTAQGITGYDELSDLQDGKLAWQHARDWVLTRASGVITDAFATEVLGAGTWFGGNSQTDHSVGEEAGTYTVTEIFQLNRESNAFVAKQFDFSEQQDSFDASYNGTIAGIATNGKSGDSSAITNAKALVPDNATATAEATAALSDFLGSQVLGEPTSKNIAIDEITGVVAYSFAWLPSEDVDATTVQEATIDYDATSGEYTINYTLSVVGKGATVAIRLANARDQIPDNATARTTALDLLDDLVPAGVDINTLPISVGTSVNETQGTARSSWTWKNVNTEFGQDLILDVRENLPATVFVEIPIPGRESGPVQQDMNTVTSKIITVTLTKENNVSRPDDGEMQDIMDDAGGIDPTWFLQQDEITYNPITNNYNRTRTHVVKL
jgi:hypothetical protein